MSREYAGTGIGHYNNVNSIHGGIQAGSSIRKQTRSFQRHGHRPHPQRVHPLLESRGVTSRGAPLSPSVGMQSTALYQGTASAVPQRLENNSWALAPEGQS